MPLAAFGSWGGWPALTALGTVGAVIVALGLQWWLARQERRRRPKLSLAFDAHARTDEKHGATGAVLPYLRLAVSNEQGKATAEDVEVIVTDINEFVDL